MACNMKLTALARVKLALRISEEEFDSEIGDLIESALLDLGLAGADGEQIILSNPLVRTAVITYCKMHFGEPDEYERLKTSYDEQKAQLSMATGFTTWTGLQ